MVLDEKCIYISLLTNLKNAGEYTTARALLTKQGDVLLQSHPLNWSCEVCHSALAESHAGGLCNVGVAKEWCRRSQSRCRCISSELIRSLSSMLQFSCKVLQNDKQEKSEGIFESLPANKRGLFLHKSLACVQIYIWGMLDREQIGSWFGILHTCPSVEC